ncbi:KinB-signaling pathway activation protein [Bacillus aquiflavi]|uniref:KinB-signaling pathway activation protein n=1 Tax=Bacillus aquiflavi TaxID=2672567 RepID=A0A6B3W1G6_9BACI|nr:KinB-signaling pathway activation protein [Bacillus aquiflavi]MBA4538712.1 KinB-signaling pathway activation protein [Bacillus aquiflavi]NEY83072.1 KinB-signaling pathway activation protein [Bacillus aquiflavi]UAC48335.1 KinB-signaling pathway activation protein [Bacillus aquiflavi]
MTSRNWVKLFISTLIVGGLTTGIVGFTVRWGEFEHLFTDLDILGILSTLIWLIGVGFIFSIISQMGFFAYLTVHRFGIGIFRTVSLWNSIQLFLIAFVLFDLVYFRFQAFADKGESLSQYIWKAIFILAVGLIVAFIKAKQTNKAAFIPALFFMVVVTILEWVPVLRVNEESWLYLMLFPLMACNAYQLLILHKLNEKSMQERRLKSSKKPS